MSLAIVYSRAGVGIEAPLVTVEVHLSHGLPSLNIVGLPEAAVKESKDRVRSAIINSNFEFPARRITINLAPADLPKEGGRFDLPIALGILAASGQLPSDYLSHYEFIGELALTGELRPVKGVLPVALACTEDERTLVVPEANSAEAGLVPSVQAVHAKHLLDVCQSLMRNTPLPECINDAVVHDYDFDMDMSDVIAQETAKRALTIAAAGKHHLLFMALMPVSFLSVSTDLPTTPVLRLH